MRLHWLPYRPGAGTIAICSLSAALLLTAPTVDARDYFVSRTGNDRQPGTRSAPWKSIWKVNQTPLAPGDSVLFHGRQAFRGNLVVAHSAPASASRPITVGAYGKGRATISAGRHTAVSIRNTGGIVVQDLILRGAGPTMNLGFGLEILNEACDDSKLDSVVVRDVEAGGFRWAGIYVGGPVREGQRWCAAGLAGFRNVLLSRCVALQNAYCGIHVSGRWVSAPALYANQDVRIIDSVAHDNPGDPHNLEGHSGDGILIENTERGVIERCTAYRNGGRCGSRGGGPVGIWAHNAAGILIQRCQSYRNRTGGAADGGGFDFDGGVSGSVMQYNRSYENDGPGYMIWSYAHATRPIENNVIRYNLSQGDARRHCYGAVHLGTAGEPLTAIQIYGNTILMKPSSAGTPSLISVQGKSNKSVRLSGNVLLAAGACPLILTEGARDAITYEGNTFRVERGKFLVIDNGRVYDSSAAWRAETGRELLPDCEASTSIASAVTSLDLGPRAVAHLRSSCQGTEASGQ
jgi:hypothetical protein